MASMSACHAGDPGSNPGRGVLLGFTSFLKNFCKIFGLWLFIKN